MAIERPGLMTFEGVLRRGFAGERERVRVELLQECFKDFMHPLVAGARAEKLTAFLGQEGWSVSKEDGGFELRIGRGKEQMVLSVLRDKNKEISFSWCSGKVKGGVSGVCFLWSTDEKTDEVILTGLSEERIFYLFNQGGNALWLQRDNEGRVQLSSRCNIPREELFGA